MLLNVLDARLAKQVLSVIQPKQRRQHQIYLKAKVKKHSKDKLI